MVVCLAVCYLLTEFFNWGLGDTPQTRVEVFRSIDSHYLNNMECHTPHKGVYGIKSRLG